MYAAHTSTGELVYAKQAAQYELNNSLWFCPLCWQEVKLKISSKGSGYFSHSGPCMSGMKFARRSTKESEDHLSAKELLVYFLTQSGYKVKTEYYFEAVNQTADVVVSSAKSAEIQYIIEFQRSPISPKQVAKRQQAYLKITKRPLWLVDYDIFKRGKVQTWHQTMLNFSLKNGFHWVSLDLARRKIVVIHHVPLLFSPYQLKFQEESIFLEQFSQGCLDLVDDHFLDRGHPIKQQTWVDFSEVNYQKRLQRLRGQRVYQKDLQAMYDRGYLIQSLPSWILMERWQFLVMKSPAWLVFAWGYIALEELSGELFVTGDFAEKIKGFIRQRTIQVAVMPFVEIDVCFKLSEVILAIFKEKGHVIQCGFDEWQVT